MKGRMTQPLEKRQARAKKPAEKRVVTFFDQHQAEFMPGDRCLEIGVGEGRQLLAPASHGLELYGIDCDPAALELLAQVTAERGVEIQAELGEITELPYPDSHFRVGYGTSVFQMLANLDEAVKTFKEVARVLVPGGIFFLKVNGNPKRENADRHKRVEYLSFHEVIHLAEQAGLVVETTEIETEADERRIGGVKLLWFITLRKVG